MNSAQLKAINDRDKEMDDLEVSHMLVAMQNKNGPGQAGAWGKATSPDVGVDATNKDGPELERCHPATESEEGSLWASLSTKAGQLFAHAVVLEAQKVGCVSKCKPLIMVCNVPSKLTTKREVHQLL
jgi:hypothetical protein